MSALSATASSSPHQPTLSEWVPVIAWCTVIFILSGSTFSAANTARIVDPFLRWLIPGLSQPGAEMLHALIRKTAHFTEYGILFFLMIRGPMKGRPYTALMLCVAYAFVDEGHQAFMPGRTASLYDVALDGTGALFSRFVQLAFAEMV